MAAEEGSNGSRGRIAGYFSEVISARRVTTVAATAIAAVVTERQRWQQQQ